ncbi:MAG: hypothetical protein ACREMO_09620, partial [Gemmatimonadales bacterium]
LQAFSPAEAGADAVNASWAPARYDTIPVGGALGLGTTSLGSGESYTDSLLRLNGTLFLIRSIGERRTAADSMLARSTVGRLVRLAPPTIAMNAAVTTLQGFTSTGSTWISGRDSVPVGWGSECPPTGRSRAGLRDSSGVVNTSGPCAGGGCLSGTPQVVIDSGLTSAALTGFGSLSFADLFGSADVRVSGSVGGLGPAALGVAPSWTCDRSIATNWGGPSGVNPCSRYFPIIAGSGGTRITGGTGQGVLLVAGDLEMTGGFEFFGPVIVLGTFRSTGAGGHIQGGLLAAKAEFDATPVAGGSGVDFSGCAIGRALQGSARARPLAARSWLRLYD